MAYHRSRILASAGIALALSASYANAALPLSTLSQLSQNGEPTLAPMLEKVTPAVVNISSKGHVRVQDNPLLNDPVFRRFFNVPDRPREKETQSLGSGVVIDAKNGYIITNNHVIDKADEITVTLRDRRILKAKLIGSDKETDIAVIKVTASGLTDIPLADSDKMRVGDFVVAIGNPFGLGQTVTSGIVSALGRSGLGIEGYEDFIQTDASINPGNSGGALVNLRGELVGINTAILAPNGGNVGIGFAIPMNMVRDIKEQLTEFGEVKRGKLGVAIQDMTPELATAFGLKQVEGAVVSQVAPNSSADKAGLKSGDVLTHVNSKPVSNSADLRNIIGLLRAGQKVTLTALRNGKEINLTAVITAAEQKRIAGAKINGRFDGAVFGVIEEDGNLSDHFEGIQVVSVEMNSAAWQTGLREGDIILSVNRLQVKDFEEFKTALTKSRRGILLNIQRGEGGLFLLIQ